jgi:hypothetical protein
MKSLEIRIGSASRLLAIAFCATTGVLTASTVTFSDGTFNPANYTTGFLFIGTPGTTATYAQCASCGNTGQALAITITEPSGGTAAAADVALGIINTTFAYDPLTQGAITSISASMDKDFTINQTVNYGFTFRPLIEQDGNFFTAAIIGSSFTGPGSTGYINLSNTLLTASDFVQINPLTGVTGTANPNFAGDPMLFGIAQLFADSGIPNTIAVLDNDNLNLTLTTVSGTPEPASGVLFCAGLAGLALLRRRKV